MPYTASTPEIYQDLVYCEGAESATIENAGDGVWVVSASAFLDMYRWSEMSNFTRWTFQEEMQAQGLVVLAPGDIAVIPAGITTPVWIPHYAVTAAWEVQKIAIERLSGLGEEYILDAFKNGLNPHQKALINCAEEAYNEVIDAAENDQWGTALDHVQVGLTAVKTGTCVAATEQADADLQKQPTKAGKVPQKLPPATSTWAQKVNTLSGGLDETIDVGRVIADAPSGCVFLKIRLCF